MGVASAWDIYWTANCLEVNSGCYERNPLGTTTEKRIALKAAAWPVAVGVDYFLRRKGHHTTARIFAIAVSALQFAAGVHNIVQAKK